MKQVFGIRHEAVFSNGDAQNDLSDWDDLSDEF